MAAEILIVDDHPGNLMALEAVLAPLGRKVVRADSGEEALKALLKQKFAVVLLDVQMKGLDGFQTAALIRNRPSTADVPIIFLTGYDAEFRQARRAYDLGAFDYIVKPFDAEILRNKVKAFVRLSEQEDELKEASETARVRDVFIGVLGHDLRNPLGAIQMGASLLERASDIPERHRSTAVRISRSANRMQRLIEDVLDFTRGQLGGGIPVSLAPVNLGGLCRQIIDELQGAHPERDISLTVEGDLDGEWDGARLGQVISNLVGNAIQHCSTGVVRVVVQGDAACARLSVTNPGCIPEAVLPRLFQPFRRGDDSSAGLGLGLYIVREIVRAHAGEVSVHSNGKTNETVFTVSLPRAVVPARCACADGHR